MTVIKYISDQEFNKTKSALTNCLNKQQALDFVNEFKRVLSFPCSVSKDGREMPITDFVSPKKIYEWKLNDLVSFLALVISDTAIVQAYIDSLPREYRELMEILYRQLALSETDIRNLGLESVLCKDRDSWYYGGFSIASSHSVWFSSCFALKPDSKNSYYHSRCTYFMLNRSFVWMLDTVMIPRTRRSLFFRELPPDVPLNVFDAEQDAFASYPAFLAACKQGALDSASGKVTAAASQKLSKALSITEVLPDLSDIKMKCSYGQFLFPFLNMVPSGKAKKYQTAAKDVVERFWRMREEFIFPILLPFVKGLRATALSRYACFHALNLIKEALESSDKHWIDLEALSYLTVDRSYTLGPRAMEDLYLTNAFTNEVITFSDVTSQIDLSVMQACCLTMYSLGAVTLACENFDPAGCLTPLDHIRYARLNSFGEYLFGLSKSYDAPDVQSEKYFELDPNRLVIHSLVPGNSYEKLLRDIAVPIGNGRYKLTPESFLAHCRTEYDVKDKTDFVKDYVCSELPEVWMNFFSTIRRRCFPFESPKDEYYLYKLKDDDRDLAMLISTDPVLKETVIKAEGYFIMIPVKKLQVFKLRLKTFGYLI